MVQFGVLASSCSFEIETGLNRSGMVFDLMFTFPVNTVLFLFFFPYSFDVCLRFGSFYAHYRSGL